MQRWFRATAAIGVSAALAGVTVLLAAAAGPAAAGSVHDNFAYGSYAPAGAITSRLHGLAESPPAETTTVANVNVTSLLSTGFTNDTAWPAGAASRIHHVSASTSWTSAGTTYTFSLRARNVASFCSNTSSSASAFTRITRGKLTETAQTGSSVTRQVIHLPRRPPAGTAYAFNGGTVTLNAQTPLHGLLETQGIVVATPAQTLWIAVTGCEPAGGPGAIANGGFENSTSSLAPWDTTGTAGVETTGFYDGANAAQVGPSAAPGTASSSTLYQTFIADGDQLSLFYQRQCTAGSGNDASVTLADLTRNKTFTPLPSDCASDPDWRQLTATLRPGDTYTLTITNVNGTAQPNRTLIDEVTVSLG